jgi:mannosyltransferase OCH1-like enzyme
MIYYIILFILSFCILYIITNQYRESKEITELNRSAIPKIIFQTWKTHDLPKQFEYWSSTWKKYNPDYKYILWDDKENRDFVATHFDWFLPVFDSYDAGIKRADAIRYMFLYHHGGIYADLDFECLRPFDELLEKYKSYDIILGSMESDLSSWHLSNNIPNAIMISKPGCTFWLKLLKELERRSKIPGRPEVQTGPIVLKDVYRHPLNWGYSIKVLPPADLYPISWVTDEEERKEALKSEPLSLTQKMKAKYPDSYAVTYWAHSW